MGVALVLWGFEFWQWLALLQHELLLFAGVFFLIGALDDLDVADKQAQDGERAADGLFFVVVCAIVRPVQLSQD